MRERAMMDERDEATAADLEMVEAIGRTLMRDPDHPSWSDARFLEWLAADAREESRHGRRHSSPRVRGEALIARSHARRLRVKQAGAVPLLRGVGVPEKASGRAVPVVELGIAEGGGPALRDEPAEAWVELPSDA